MGLVVVQLDSISIYWDICYSSVLLLHREECGKFVDLTRVATIAGATSLAVDHLLGRENNRSSGCETIQDIEAVGDS